MTANTLEQSTALQLADAAASPQQSTAVMPGFNSNSSWELAQRIGKAFASSSLVPEAYRGNLANCIVALEMANRMGASPLMVMQNLYIVHGNPGWSSKFLIASFNQCGRFSAMRYDWSPDRSACRAWAIELKTNDKLVGPQVTIEMAKAEGWATKTGSKWKTMPELMLMYRAAAFFVRTYAPEISMGLRTDDELLDTVERVEPTSSLQSVRQALHPQAAPQLPEPQPEGLPRDLAHFIDRVDNSMDPDEARGILDEAAQVLTPEDMAQLNEQFERAWKS